MALQQVVDVRPIEWGHNPGKLGHFVSEGQTDTFVDMNKTHFHIHMKVFETFVCERTDIYSCFECCCFQMYIFKCILWKQQQGALWILMSSTAFPCGATALPQPQTR